MSEDITSLSDEELLKELHVAEDQATLSNNLQYALKICLNSGYGAVGNKHFLYYKVENAEAITLSGQLINKWTHVRVNKILNSMFGTSDVNYAVAGDTDSIYLNLAPVVKMAKMDSKTDDEITNFIDKFMKEVLTPKIDAISNELCAYMNGMRNMMVWSREAIAPVSIFVRKKGYVMRITDSEGVRFKTPKVKVMGLEAVKSSTPAWSRKLLKECYVIGLDNDKDRLHDRVKEIRTEFDNLSISEIAIPRGANNLDKYTDPVNIYSKGTPKQVKAALIHNWYCDKLGLSHIDRINGGGKIKFIELKRPNPINQSVIGFTWYMPKEFELDAFVDRDAIFESAFLTPLQIFLTSIGWTHEPVVSLESFFG